MGRSSKIYGKDNEQKIGNYAETYEYYKHVIGTYKQINRKLTIAGHATIEMSSKLFNFLAEDKENLIHIFLLTKESEKLDLLFREDIEH